MLFKKIYKNKTKQKQLYDILYCLKNTDFCVKSPLKWRYYYTIEHFIANYINPTWVIYLNYMTKKNTNKVKQQMQQRFLCYKMIFSLFQILFAHRKCTRLLNFTRRQKKILRVTCMIYLRVSNNYSVVRLLPVQHSI